MAKQWVLIYQDEGLMVDWEQSEEVDVIFIDYDEAKQTTQHDQYEPEYVLDKIDRLTNSSIDPDLKIRHLDSLKGYLREEGR